MNANARFEAVFREHGPAIARVVASYARDRADADDLGQDVMLALHRALPKFRGECSERAFVLRVAHNRGLHHVLRRRPSAEAPVELADPAPGPDAQIAAREDSERLFAAIRRLTIPQRQVLSLALEGLSHAEIAEVLGVRVDNVAVRLSRARAALKLLLNEEDPS